MKRLLISALAALLTLASMTLNAFAQTSERTSLAPSQTKSLPAAALLYEEASNYSSKKFQEFARARTPFDSKLLEKTLKEQRELAARHAASLAARKDLAGEDLFYLGMLYNLAENAGGAIEALKRYLSSAAQTAERAQTARYLLVQLAAGQKLFDEAEKALAVYLSNEPKPAAERIRMETALASAYFKAELPERALSHADEAFKAAKLFRPTPASGMNPDQAVYTSGMILVNALVELKRTERAAAILEEIRVAALTIPSLRLYLDATEKLAAVFIDDGRKADAVKMLEESIAYTTANVKDQRAQSGLLLALNNKLKQTRLMGERAPEITVARWIDQKPVKLSDLRGQVVLIDFWASWCGPCLAAFPHLTGWYEKYKDRGFVILGLTRYYGTGEGRAMQPAEEITFLQSFKKEHRLPYGIGVAETGENHNLYGVSGIPTAVLIDRQGKVRLFTTGASAADEKEIAAAIEKLIEEK